MKRFQTPRLRRREGRATGTVLVLGVASAILIGVFVWWKRAGGAEDPADQLARERVAAYFADDDRARMSEAIAPLVERSDPDPEDLASAAAIALR